MDAALDQANASGGYDLEGGLTALAPRLEPGGTGIANLARLSAGATQELWRFDVVAGDRLVPLIVRRPPGGDPAWIDARAVWLDAAARSQSMLCIN